MSSANKILNDAIAAYAAAAPIQSYLKPNSSKFILARAPNITWTCQSTNLPVMNLGSAMQQTSFVDIPHPGDKVSYEELSIKFLINEDLSNYLEIYNWMVQLGTPYSGEQWDTTIRNRITAFNAEDYNNVFSDGALLILNSNNRPIVKVVFQDLFPISLEALEFDITSGGMEYFTGNAIFKYKLFTVESI